jgi:hypothetical protein
VPRLTLPCLVVATLACEPGPAVVEVDLSWRFADGRPCDLAGVQSVEVRSGAGGDPERVHCDDGLAPDRSHRIAVVAPAEIGLEALSVTGARLYAGRTRIEPDASGPPVVVTLRFVGGE